MTIQVRPLNQMDIIKLKPDLYVRFLRYGYYSESNQKLEYQLKMFYVDELHGDFEIGSMTIIFKFKYIEYGIYYSIIYDKNKYYIEYHKNFDADPYGELLYESIIALIEHINLVLQIEDEENKEDISQFLNIYLQLIPGVG